MILKQNDISRAFEVARAIAIPANREIIHVIPRGYVVMVKKALKTQLGCLVSAGG